MAMVAMLPRGSRVDQARFHGRPSPPEAGGRRGPAEARRSPDGLGEPPTAYAIVYSEADYFAVTKYSEDYTFDGK